MQVDIQNLTKKFGNVVAVDSLNLDIKSGEFVAFLGPSGCGKTTTLLMVAGIYKPTDGIMRFGDVVVNQLQPRERNIGMVFQSYALYPHMTAYSNIAYPLKLKGISKNEQNIRVQRVADVMGIGHLLDRRPSQLSGGQQQRVALGRALVKEPDLLLFDEPLSNLDARLRLTMRGEIKHLQRDLGITSIYVTHDQIEALTMADRIAVMNQGKLEAFDTPEGLYERPKTLFIAGFVGNPPMNFVDVEVGQNGAGPVATNNDLKTHFTIDQVEKVLAHKGPVTMGIRPEDIVVDDGSDIRGEVYLVEPLGRDDLIDVRIGDTRMLALSDPKLKIQPGDTVGLRFNPERLQFYDPQTNQSLVW